MPNTVYADEVLANKLNAILTTKLETRSLMDIDTSLAESAGMKKTFNVYTYSGVVESVAQGNGVANPSSIAYTPTTYTVNVYQQEFPYYDEEVMQDGAMLDFAIQGAADTMINRLNSSFFTELQKATLELPYANGGSPSYDNFVDAISLMNLEDESGLYIIISPSIKAALRKDADFVSARQGEIVYTGQIGFLAGIPVIQSAACPTGVAYIADKSAVSLFLKKDSEVEQVRDGITRKNTLVMRQVALAALRNATKVVVVLPYVSTPVITTAAIAAGNNKAFAGTCQAGSEVRIVKDGVPIAGAGGLATVVAGAWTYTIPVAVAAEVYSVVSSATNYADAVSANGITVA